MSIATTKSKAAIDINGGGTIKIKEVTEAGVDLSSPDTFHDIGYIEDSDYNDDRAKVKAIDETGVNQRTIFTTRTVMVNATMMQSATANFAFATEVADKFYQLYKYNGVVGGYHQEMFFSIGNITPQIKVKWGANQIIKSPFEYEAVNNASAVNIAASACGAYCASASLSATTITIPAGTIYVMRETLA